VRSGGVSDSVTVTVSDSDSDSITDVQWHYGDYPRPRVADRGTPS